MRKSLQQIKSWSLFKLTLKNVFLNYNFILFHFIIFFIPFYSTLISAIQGPDGSLYVISVGLATSFITIFNQFLFLLSAALVFVCKNKHTIYQNSNSLNTIDRNSVNSIVFIVSLLSIGFFILTSYFYIAYSSSYANISNSGKYGLNYVLILSPSLLFNAFIYLNLIYLNEINKKLTTVILIGFLIINLILIPIFYLYVNFNDELLITFSIGLAVSISSFICFLFIHFCFNNHYYLKFKPKQIWLLIKKSSTFIINFLLATFMKTILIVAIALSLALSTKDTPINLMLAKIIWYNSLYFCEFFADGLLYSIEYANMKNFANKSCDHFSVKAWLFMSGLSSFVVLITCIIFNLATPAIAQLYTSHQINTITNPLPFWPYQGNVNATEISDYLWQPNGVYNFKLMNINHITHMITYQKVPAFALLYTTIYHVVISATKIMGLSKINFDQKFNLKAIFSKFIIVAIVMVFISVFSIVPADDAWFNKIWPGIDGFSFSLMLIGIVLFLLTFANIKKVYQQKEVICKLDYNFDIS